MTSTPSAKTATAARVAGFLALLAAGTALLVLFAAAAHAAPVIPRTTPSTPSGCTARRRAPPAPATLWPAQGRWPPRPARSPVHAHQAADPLPEARPAHSGSRAELAGCGRNHKAALPARAQGARYAHSRSNPDSSGCSDQTVREDAGNPYGQVSSVIAGGTGSAVPARPELGQEFGGHGDLRHTVQVALRQVCAWLGIRPASTRARPVSSLSATNFRSRTRLCAGDTPERGGRLDHDR